MKSRSWTFLIAAMCATLVLVLALLIWSAPKHPVAMLNVVDATGKPVAGAIIHVEGIRTKPGPYSGGEYRWNTDENHLPDVPATTDKNGHAPMAYPKYVFERIETGTLCLNVDHPEFVPQRFECVVSTKVPAGAPWRVIADDLWKRIQHRTLITKTAPLVLKQGAILKLSAKHTAGAPETTPIFAQVSKVSDVSGTNFWERLAPDVLVTRRLEAGISVGRAFRLDSNRLAWFSDVFQFKSVAGKTNELTVEFKLGHTVRGQLDASVPRPIKNGRVIAHVWPTDESPPNNPPQWHDWAAVKEDGTFEVPSLPPGDLEILALCDGYVSTNGVGKSSLRHPQKHVLGTNNISIVIGMERTARLEVLVTDDHDKPLQDALVSTWPNIQYGDWFATLLGSDRYKTSDLLVGKVNRDLSDWLKSTPELNGKTDSNGIAILRSLPLDVTVFSVEHEHYLVPAIIDHMGRKEREVAIKLQLGITNHATIKLEPRGFAPVKHY